MFKIDPHITEKGLKGKSIFKVLISMNSHQVATPETSLEDARSYVFFFREEQHRLSAYIGLHLLLTDRKLFYGYSSNPFKEDDLPEVEDAARDFAEYLGAMLDEVAFENMSDLEQDKWIEAQDIFSEKAQPQSEAVTEPVTAPTSPEVEQEAEAEFEQEVEPEAVSAAAPAVAPVEHAPAPEVAVAASAPQPPSEPEQPAPAAEMKSAPVPPAMPVQPAPKPQPPEAKEQPREASAADAGKKTVQTQAPPVAAAKQGREIPQKEAATGIEMSPKQTMKRKDFSATGVVSRDREALARLLTSF